MHKGDEGASLYYPRNPTKMRTRQYRYGSHSQPTLARPILFPPPSVKGKPNPPRSQLSLLPLLPPSRHDSVLAFLWLRYSHLCGSLYCSRVAYDTHDVLFTINIELYGEWGQTELDVLQPTSAPIPHPLWRGGRTSLLASFVFAPVRHRRAVALQCPAPLHAVLVWYHGGRAKYRRGGYGCGCR